jgi:hypothetical protein
MGSVYVRARYIDRASVRRTYAKVRALGRMPPQKRQNRPCSLAALRFLCGAKGAAPQVRLSRPSSVKPHLRCYSVVGSSALTAVVVNCPYGASITFVAGEAERHEANKNRLPFRLMELGSGFRAICSRVLSPKINNRHEFSTRHWMAASAPLQQPVRPALWLRPSLESLSTNPDGDDDDDDDDDNDKRRVTCCTCNVVAFKSGGGIRSEVLPRIPIVPGCLHRYLSTDTIVAINHVPLFRGFAGADATAPSSSRSMRRNQASRYLCTILPASASGAWSR